MEIKCTKAEQEEILKCFLDVGYCPFTSFRLNNKCEQGCDKCEKCLINGIQWVITDEVTLDEAYEFTKLVSRGVKNLDDYQCDFINEVIKKMNAKEMANEKNNNAEG